MRNIRFSRIKLFRKQELTLRVSIGDDHQGGPRATMPSDNSDSDFASSRSASSGEAQGTVDWLQEFALDEFGNA